MERSPGPMDPTEAAVGASAVTDGLGRHYRLLVALALLVAATLLAALLLLAAPAAQAQGVGFITKWGSEGSGGGQFERPGRIATDPAGNVYVVDYGNDRIQKFDPNGAFLAKWGSLGNGPGQFYQAGSIATDRQGNVYVSNPWTNNVDQIQKFTSNGAFITRWESNASVSAMAGGPDGNLYIASSGLHYEEVQKLSPNGTVLQRWGPNSSGAGDGQFRGLLDIAVAPDGTVYTLDQGSEGDHSYSPRVQRFNSNGAFLAKWGSQGTGDGQFSGHSLGGLATDANGNVWVSDGRGGTDRDPDDAPRVQAFTATGSFLGKLTGSSSSSDNRRSFFCLEDGIATGAAGSLYLVEWCADQIWRFGSGGGGGGSDAGAACDRARSVLPILVRRYRLARRVMSRSVRSYRTWGRVFVRTNAWEFRALRRARGRAQRASSRYFQARRVGQNAARRYFRERRVIRSEC